MPEDIRQEFRKSLNVLAAKILICFKYVSDGKHRHNHPLSVQKITSKPHTGTFFYYCFLQLAGGKETQRGNITFLKR